MKFVFVFLFWASVSIAGELPPIEKFSDVFGESTERIFELSPQENLNLEETQERIKKRYRQLSLAYHPDRHQNSEQSNKIFKFIKELYNSLSRGIWPSVKSSFYYQNERARPSYGSEGDAAPTFTREEKIKIILDKFASVPLGAFFDSIVYSFEQELEKTRWNEQNHFKWIFKNFPRPTMGIGAGLFFTGGYTIATQSELFLPLVEMIAATVIFKKGLINSLIYDSEWGLLLRIAETPPEKIRAIVTESFLLKFIQEIDQSIDKKIGPAQNFFEVSDRMKFGLAQFGGVIKKEDARYRDIQIFALYAIFYQHYSQSYSNILEAQRVSRQMLSRQLLSYFLMFLEGAKSKKIYSTLHVMYCDDILSWH